MKYVFAIICLIVGMICYFFPEFVNSNSNIFLGLLFIYVGNLFVRKKED